MYSCECNKLCKCNKLYYRMKCSEAICMLFYLVDKPWRKLYICVVGMERSSSSISRRNGGKWTGSFPILFSPRIAICSFSFNEVYKFIIFADEEIVVDHSRHIVLFAFFPSSCCSSANGKNPFYMARMLSGRR